MKKKLLVAMLLTGASMMSMANTVEQNIRAKAEQYYLNKNYTESYKEYTRLAKQGDAQSLYNTAYMMRHGQGTKKNEKKAVKAYEQAAKQNYPLAHLALAEAYLLSEMGLKNDPAKVKYHLEQASQLGSAEASVELANIYFAEGTEASEQKAIALLQPLIDKNNFSAMHLRAVYDLGYGLKNANEASIVKGLQTLENLTKQGHIPSMLAVANMAMHGEVIPQNLTLAKNLYSILVQNNVPTAKERLAEVEQMMATPTKP